MPDGAVASETADHRTQMTTRSRHTTPRAIRCGARTLTPGPTPLVMGIVNVTPDSFSDGGRHLDPSRAIAHARAMIHAGADIIDIGGESTRPGSEGVSERLEMERVLPVIEGLFEHGDPGVPLSIDTRKPSVARAALERGCTMVNDIGAAELPEMVDVLRERDDVAVVAMHKRGDPRTMQDAPHYDDVVGEVVRYPRAARRNAGGSGHRPRAHRPRPRNRLRQTIPRQSGTPETY